MKRATFFSGVIFALVVSISAAILFAVLGTLFPSDLLLQAIITASGLAYILYLLGRSREKTGRIVVLSLWLVASAAIWLLAPSLAFYALAHIGMIWVVRSLYFHASLLSALADLGLNIFAFAAALWISWHTHSLFLSVWSFFLVQALFSSIPSRVGRHSETANFDSDSDDQFLQAHRAAESAVRKLSVIN